jgi:hypothetical protein
VRQYFRTNFLIGKIRARIRRKKYSVESSILIGFHILRVAGFGTKGGRIELLARRCCLPGRAMRVRGVTGAMPPASGEFAEVC